MELSGIGIDPMSDLNPGAIDLWPTASVGVMRLNVLCEIKTTLTSILYFIINNTI